MKIYICADIEGIAGVVTRGQIVPDGFEYQRAREWMTDEVVAAIKGATAAGATEFVIADSHGNGQSLLMERLPETVTLTRSWPRKLHMMAGVELGGFDGAFLIGHHCGATDPGGVLSHSFHGGAFAEIRINGVPANETKINAALAGHFGVPVLLATGDSDYVTQVHDMLGAIPTVTTKWAHSVVSARTILPKRSCALIEAAAREAVSKRSAIQPYRLDGPLTLEIRFNRRGAPEILGLLPWAEQIGPHTVRFEVEDIVALNNVINFAGSYDPMG